jgi:hypothetical protein
MRNEEGLSKRKLSLRVWRTWSGHPPVVDRKNSTMARILYKGDWFEEIGSHGHYEAEFENILQSESSRIFESYYFVPFKIPVFSDVDADTRQADFALVHKSYRNWWVVEVELAHHSLHNHVLPQVQTLAHATYGTNEAVYLCEQYHSLDREKVFEMFKGDQPRVLVIVNSPVSGWLETLAALKAQVMICQIYRDQMNRNLLRVNGDYPYEDEEVITRCECHRQLHRMVSIHSPANLPVQRNETMLLYHRGTATEWERIDTARAVFLHALRDHDLTPGISYEIVRTSDGSLVLRVGSPQATKLGGL